MAQSLKCVAHCQHPTGTKLKKVSGKQNIMFAIVIIFNINYRLMLSILEFIKSRKTEI